MSDFGEILDRWDSNTKKSYGRKKLNKDARSKSATPAEEVNKIKINPMELWLNRYGVIDKDAELEQNSEQNLKIARNRKRLLNMKPDETVDLHGMTTDEAEAVLRALFERAVRENYVKVLIVHGKGNHSKTGAVLKNFVRQFLEQHPNAGETGHPKGADGGTGSTWVLIK